MRATPTNGSGPTASYASDATHPVARRANQSARLLGNCVINIQSGGSSGVPHPRLGPRPTLRTRRFFVFFFWALFFFYFFLNKTANHLSEFGLVSRSRDFVSQLAASQSGADVCRVAGRPALIRLPSFLLITEPRTALIMESWRVDARDFLINEAKRWILAAILTRFAVATSTLLPDLDAKPFSTSSEPTLRCYDTIRKISVRKAKRIRQFRPDKQRRRHWCQISAPNLFVLLDLEPEKLWNEGMVRLSHGTCATLLPDWKQRNRRKATRPTAASFLLRWPDLISVFVLCWADVYRVFTEFFFSLQIYELVIERLSLDSFSFESVCVCVCGLKRLISWSRES